MPLIAHLGDDPVFLLRLHQHLGFLEAVCQWLFDIDVLAALHGRYRRRVVRVVRCRYADGVDVIAHLIEHHPEVLELLDVWKLFEVFSDAAGTEVDVGEGDGLGISLRTDSGDHAIGAASGTDAAQVDPLAGRHVALCVGTAQRQIGRHEGEPECSSGFLDEISAGIAGLGTGGCFRCVRVCHGIVC